MSDTSTFFLSSGNANIVNLTAPMIDAAQIIELATAQTPTSAQPSGWGSYLSGGGSLDQMASAFVASTMFANLYNGGVLVDPNPADSFDRPGHHRSRV